MQEPSPDLLMPAELVQGGLGILATALRRRLKQVVGVRLRPYDLTIQQFWVMLVLLEQGPLSLHPLAQRVWMDDPTASRVVKTMVRQGLLETKADPSHGRRIHISLAPKAQPLAQELQTLAAEIRTTLVAGLSPEAQGALRQGLHAMIANLDGMLAQEASIPLKPQPALLPLNPANPGPALSPPLPLALPEASCAP